MQKTPSASVKPSGIADSVQLSLSVTGESAIASLVENALSRPDSAQISLRGPVSAMLNIVNRLGKRAAEVSAVISLRGDAPSR